MSPEIPDEIQLPLPTSDRGPQPDEVDNPDCLDGNDAEYTFNPAIEAEVEEDDNNEAVFVQDDNEDDLEGIEEVEEKDKEF